MVPVHGQADVGLGQRRRVVGAVAGHGDQAPAGLLLFDVVQLVGGRCLGQEVVDAGLGGDGGGRQRVVAGDHDGANAHRAHLAEALFHAALDHVLQVDHAQAATAIGDGQRSTALPRDHLRDGEQILRRLAALFADEANDCLRGALAQAAVVDVDAAHAGVGGKRDEVRLVAGHLAAPQAVFALCQDHDRTPFRGLVGQAGELGRIRQLGFADAFHGDEFDGLAVADGDRAGFVEQNHVDVAGQFDRLAAFGDDVGLKRPVHARDADG